MGRGWQGIKHNKRFLHFLEVNLSKAQSAWLFISTLTVQWQRRSFSQRTCGLSVASAKRSLTRQHGNTHGNTISNGCHSMAAWRLAGHQDGAKQLGRRGFSTGGDILRGSLNHVEPFTGRSGDPADQALLLLCFACMLTIHFMMFHAFFENLCNDMLAIEQS